MTSNEFFFYKRDTSNAKPETGAVTMEYLLSPGSMVFVRTLADLKSHIMSGGYVTRVAWLRESRASIPRLGIQQVSPRLIDASINFVGLEDALAEDWVAIKESDMKSPEIQNRDDV